MVSIDEMIEFLEDARNIGTDTKDADDNIDSVISDLNTLQNDIDDLLEGISDTLLEMEDDEKVVTSTDDASYNEGYIDALVSTKESILRIFNREE